MSAIPADIVHFGPTAAPRWFSPGRRLTQLSPASSAPQRSCAPPATVAGAEEWSSRPGNGNGPAAGRAGSAALVLWQSVGGEQWGVWEGSTCTAIWWEGEATVAGNDCHEYTYFKCP